jgi:hypothetical protein
MDDVMRHVKAILGKTLSAVVPVAAPRGAELWNIEFLRAGIARDLE